MFDEVNFVYSPIFLGLFTKTYLYNLYKFVFQRYGKVNEPYGETGAFCHDRNLFIRLLFGKEKDMNMIFSFTALALIFTVLPVLAADNMKAFPPPENGMVRYVLQLPQQDNESEFKVELLVGKTVQIDEKNQYFFGGKIQEKTIKGWGFPRYLVRELGPMAGTLMAVDPNAPRVSRFIRLGGEPYLIRYNSRLPIVVYVPKGVEVRYRIWSASSQAKGMKEG